ncbi:MAG: acyl carrier protein [Actinomycetes bacterium]
MSTTLIDTFTTILVDTFGVEADQVAPDATFEELGLDSLDVVELTLVLEEETGVKLEDEELEDVRTVGDAIAKVEARSVTA